MIGCLVAGFRKCHELFAPLGIFYVDSLFLAGNPPTFCPNAMPEKSNELASFSADEITASNLKRRKFLSRLGRVALVAPALPLLAACSGSDDCDADTGDPVSAQSDSDTGDSCDSD